MFLTHLKQVFDSINSTCKKYTIVQVLSYDADPGVMAEGASMVTTVTHSCPRAALWSVFTAVSVLSVREVEKMRLCGGKKNCSLCASCFDSFPSASADAEVLYMLSDDKCDYKSTSCPFKASLFLHHMKHLTLLNQQVCVNEE